MTVLYAFGHSLALQPPRFIRLSSYGGGRCNFALLMISALALTRSPRRRTRGLVLYAVRWANFGGTQFADFDDVDESREAYRLRRDDWLNPSVGGFEFGLLVPTSSKNCR